HANRFRILFKGLAHSKDPRFVELVIRLISIPEPDELIVPDLVKIFLIDHQVNMDVMIIHDLKQVLARRDIAAGIHLDHSDMAFQWSPDRYGRTDVSFACFFWV